MRKKLPRIPMVPSRFAMTGPPREIYPQKMLEIFVTSRAEDAGAVCPRP